MSGERKEVMSARTREVGPVRPFSAGVCTERPHPLPQSVCQYWGRVVGRYWREGKVPPIETVDFNAAGCETCEEIVECVAYDDENSVSRAYASRLRTILETYNGR